MNYNKKLIQDANRLAQMLISSGCKTIYQGDENEGFQTLLLDGNSGTIFSVEVVPGTNSAEIRTNRRQHYQFPTQDIIARASSDTPLFSTWKAENYWNIPLVPLAEESSLLNFSPLHARIDVLRDGPEYPDLVYFTTGILPGVSQERIQAVEEQYIHDVANFNTSVENIIHEKMSRLPEAVQDFYGYTGKKAINMYEMVMQKKR